MRTVLGGRCAAAESTSHVTLQTNSELVSPSHRLRRSSFTFTWARSGLSHSARRRHGPLPQVYNPVRPPSCASSSFSSPWAQVRTKNPLRCYHSDLRVMLGVTVYLVSYRSILACCAAAGFRQFNLQLTGPNTIFMAQFQSEPFPPLKF